ncbi:MAG TPA: AtpZ/AtpI family protein [Aliidongia sp.]|nr:AtpZ/AtpI family protein [Aliidongia sp.]
MDDREAPDLLKQLGDRIDKAAGRPDTSGPKADSGRSDAMGVGMRIGVELVVAVALGAGVGWLIDRGLGSKPLGVVAGFFLGVAVGIWNVYRVFMARGAAGGK